MKNFRGIRQSVTAESASPPQSAATLADGPPEQTLTRVSISRSHTLGIHRTVCGHHALIAKKVYLVRTWVPYRAIYIPPNPFGLFTMGDVPRHLVSSQMHFRQQRANPSDFDSAGLNGSFTLPAENVSQTALGANWFSNK